MCCVLYSFNLVIEILLISSHHITIETNGTIFGEFQSRNRDTSNFKSLSALPVIPSTMRGFNLVIEILLISSFFKSKQEEKG